MSSVTAHGSNERADAAPKVADKHAILPWTGCTGCTDRVVLGPLEAGVRNLQSVSSACRSMAERKTNKAQKSSSRRYTTDG